MRKIILWITPIIVVPLSIWFLILGDEARRYYNQRAIDEGVITGEWVGGEYTRLHEQNFACPVTGELVGDVFQAGDTWQAKTNSGEDFYDRLNASYKDEQHAKHAAENFIREHKVCEKRTK